MTIIGYTRHWCLHIITENSLLQSSALFSLSSAFLLFFPSLKLSSFFLHHFPVVFFSPPFFSLFRPSPSTLRSLSSAFLFLLPSMHPLLACHVPWPSNIITMSILLPGFDVHKIHVLGLSVVCSLLLSTLLAWMVCVEGYHLKCICLWACSI